MCVSVCVGWYWCVLVMLMCVSWLVGVCWLVDWCWRGLDCVG